MGAPVTLADVKKMDNSSSNTREKALKLNLDATTYGTFAEIGGGQEVARWFFAVGGAAGTVAKTISAYDIIDFIAFMWLLSIFFSRL